MPGSIAESAIDVARDASSQAKVVPTVAASPTARVVDARLDRRLLLALVIGGIVVQIPGLFWGLPGGKAINGGLRILAGEIPYRDFWTMYAPGHFYLAAALFAVFGRHIFVSGVATIVLTAAAGGLYFRLLRQIGAPRSIAVAFGGLLIAALWSTRPELSSYEPALVLLLPALTFVVRYLQGSGVRSLVAAGALCGVGAWFKHDVSFYIAAGSAAGITIAWLTAASRPASWKRPLVAVPAVLLPAGATLLPVFLLVVWTSAADAWRDLIEFPGGGEFKVVRGERYPPVLPPIEAFVRWSGEWGNVRRASDAADQLAGWVLANAPQLAFVAAVVLLVSRRRSMRPADFGWAVVALTCMPAFWMAAHVQQNTHFYSLAILGLSLVALGWTVARSGVPGTRARRGLAAFAVFYAAGLFIRPALDVAEAAYFGPGSVPVEFPIARGTSIPAARDAVYGPIVRYIRRHVPPDEAIYVGLGRHDVIVVSNQTFYYLAERPIATRYHELHPAFSDREAVQREMIADLERLGVRCAVLWDFGWPQDMMDRILAERRRALPDIGATLLDEYFRREFVTVATYGEYRLVWRRSAGPPPAPEPPVVTPSR